MPETPLSHLQLRAYIETCGGPLKFAARHGFSWRTAQRFYTGEKPLPPRIAAEILAAMEAAR